MCNIYAFNKKKLRMKIITTSNITEKIGILWDKWEQRHENTLREYKKGKLTSSFKDYVENITSWEFRNNRIIRKENIKRRANYALNMKINYYL